MRNPRTVSTNYAQCPQTIHIRVTWRIRRVHVYAYTCIHVYTCIRTYLAQAGWQQVVSGDAKGDKCTGCVRAVRGLARRLWTEGIERDAEGLDLPPSRNKSDGPQRPRSQWPWPTRWQAPPDCRRLPGPSPSQEKWICRRASHSLAPTSVDLGCLWHGGGRGSWPRSSLAGA